MTQPGKVDPDVEQAKRAIDDIRNGLRALYRETDKIHDLRVQIICLRIAVMLLAAWLIIEGAWAK